MYKRILLPLDGSLLAEQALSHAIALAKCFQSEIVVLQVQVPLQRSPEKGDAAILRADNEITVHIREYLESVTARIQEHGIKAQMVTIKGRPHLQIIQYAEMNQVDLIVLSARGQSGLSRWMMGSITDRVVRGATVPVLMVRTKK